MEAEQNLEYVKRVLDPRRGPAVPPDHTVSPTVCQEVTFYLQAPAAPNSTAPVKPNAIIWYPMVGCLSIARYGLFLQNYVVQTTAFSGTLNYLYIIFYMMSGQTATLPQASLPILKLLTNLYIPVEDSRQLTFSPNISKALYRGRTIGARLNVISDATSINVNSLAGTFNAGVLPDSRTGYAPASLPQNTVTRKDSLLNLQVQEGVSLYMGTDISNRLNPVDNHLQFGDDDSGFEVVMNQPITLTWMSFPQLVTGAAGNAEALASIWCSSYYSCPGAGTNVVLPTIGTQDTFRYRMTTEVLHANPAGSIAGWPTTTFWVSATDMWAFETFNSVTNTFDTIVCHQQLSNANPGTGSAVLGYANVAWQSSYTCLGPQTWEYNVVRPPVGQVMICSDGSSFIIQESTTLLYAGTLFIPSANGGGPLLADYNNTVFSFNQITFYDLQLYREGQLQSTFLEWRNCAYGQNINLTGAAWVQGPADNSIAPYTQSNVGNTNAVMATNWDLLTALQILYNSSSVDAFRRIYKTKDAPTAEEVDALTIQGIFEQVARIDDSSKRTLAMSYLAKGGFLNWLGNAAKTVGRGLKAVVSNPLAQDAIRLGVGAVAPEALPLANAALSHFSSAGMMGASGHMYIHSESDEDDHDDEPHPEEEVQHADGMFAALYPHSKQNYAGLSSNRTQLFLPCVFTWNGFKALLNRSLDKTRPGTPKEKAATYVPVYYKIPKHSKGSDINTRYPFGIKVMKLGDYDFNKIPSRGKMIVIVPGGYDGEEMLFTQQKEILEGKSYEEVSEKYGKMSVAEALQNSLKSLDLQIQSILEKKKNDPKHASTYRNTLKILSWYKQSIPQLEQTIVKDPSVWHSENTVSTRREGAKFGDKTGYSTSDRYYGKRKASRYAEQEEFTPFTQPTGLLEEGEDFEGVPYSVGNTKLDLRARKAQSAKRERIIRRGLKED